MDLKSAVYNQERFQIKSGLWWCVYGTLKIIARNSEKKIKTPPSLKYFHLTLSYLCSKDTLQIFKNFHRLNLCWSLFSLGKLQNSLFIFFRIHTLFELCASFAQPCGFLVLGDYLEWLLRGRHSSPNSLSTAEAGRTLMNIEQHVI